MVVTCPKCKVKLRVADEKIAPEGSRFKCPKCSTVMLVKGQASGIKPVDVNKILVAYEDPSVAERIKSILISSGYNVTVVKDGIEAMVMSLKELPFIVVLGVSIPKIYGFEVCKKLKGRPETKDIKVILAASLVNDKRRYRRDPVSLHGADDYIEPHQIEELLIRKIDVLRGVAEKEPEKRVEEKESAGPTGVGKGPQQPLTERQPAGTSDMIEKAKRLARTIVSDIYFYNKAKFDEAILNNTFHTAFESELKEGLKLYIHRVPSETRESGDFFNEAINNFIEQRKREITK